jgi:hypothetical protein
MRLVSSPAQTNGYKEPLSTGATQVWQGTISLTPGWVEIILDNPFFLPINMNLEVYWENQYGYSPFTSADSENTWVHTTSSYARSVHGASHLGWAAATTGSKMENYFPNAKFTYLPTLTPYTGHNLAVFSAVSPLSDDITNVCSADSSPVEIVLTNFGQDNYDFTQDSIVLGAEILDPFGAIETANLVVSSGSLVSGESRRIVITPAVSLAYAGTYQVKVWVSSPIDFLRYDDTLSYSYTPQRIGLPIDDDFSQPVLADLFISAPLVGSATWAPYTPSGGDPQPLQGNGTGVLRFSGTAGSMSVISTRQLDLYGSVQPRVEFWYYHDPSLSELDNSYTNVNIVINTIPTTLFTLYKRSGTVTGWEYYSYDLTPYITQGCVLVQFESMNKRAGAQYIDRIIITSDQDLEVSKILVSPISICDHQHKQIAVVIRTTTNQAIDFSTHPADIKLDGLGVPYTVTLTNLLAGNTTDTILMIADIDLPISTYTLSAYLTTPIDSLRANDTANYVIDLHPSISMQIRPESGGTSNTDCLPGEIANHPTVVITNTGNLSLSDIGMKLYLYVGGTYVDSLFETYLISDFEPGDSIVHPFTGSYTIPWAQYYGLIGEAHLLCDSALVHTTATVTECVDVIDLMVVDILSPAGIQADTIGEQLKVSVKLRNRSLFYAYSDVKITAMIEDSKGVIMSLPAETVPLIQRESDSVYTFTMPYTVPNDTGYKLTVFIRDQFNNHPDNYSTNDTLSVIRSVVPPDTLPKIGIANIGRDGISMGQNIPNPANGTTRIDYSIPTDGQVIFRLYTVSGQELYKEATEAASGKNSMELNTSGLASGIYFYSMEYKGQRIVKRMSVHK